MRRSWNHPQLICRALLLVSLCSVCLVASQESVTCTVEITQPNASAYSSKIACEGGATTALVVVVQNRTQIRHTVTYTFNGELQTLETPGFTADGSSIWAEWQSVPALVGMGFLDPGDGSQNGILTIQAKVQDIVLPPLTVVDPTRAPQAFSALRFATVQNLIIKDSTFSRIRPFSSSTDASKLMYGAVMHADDDNLLGNVSITVSNSTFSNLTSGAGSGTITLQQIFSANANDGNSNQYELLSITNSSFTGNVAAGQGAALSLSMCSSVPFCTSVVSIEDCTFAANAAMVAGASGGAIYVVSAFSTAIKRSSFTGNTAAMDGGALYAWAGGLNASLEISGSVFSGNAAGANCIPPCNAENNGGGAIRAVTAAKPITGDSLSLLVQDSVFSNNHNIQSNRGGAVWYGWLGATTANFANGLTLLSVGRIKNTSFVDNYLPSQQSTAAAIYDTGSDGLTIDNCTFTNNTAGVGSAVYSLWSRYLTITGGTVIQNCTSKYVGGGAVAVSDLVQNFTIQNAMFLNNRCSQSAFDPIATGAAVYMERKLENAMPQNYTATLSDCQFINNRCQQAGAVHISGVSHTIGPNVLFSNNRATLPGSAAGALLLYSLNQPAQLGGVPLTSVITGTNFSGNSADSNGGALFTQGLWSPQISNCTFAGNSVQTAGVVGDVENTGGAAFVSELQLAVLSIENSTFTNNSAYNGGGIVVAQNNVVFKSCSFSSNQAVNEGGAIRWLTSGTVPRYQVNITASNFSRNTAKNAGAVQIVLAGAVISGSRFDSNAASVSGGALSVGFCQPSNATTASQLYFPAVGVQYDRQSVYIISSTFQGNVGDKGGGGAVYSESSRVISSNSNFLDSLSSFVGGAVYAYQSAVNVYQGAFARNSAPQGGALFTESSNLTLNGTQLLGNSASHGGAIASTLTRDDSRNPGLVVTELNQCSAWNNFAYSGNTLSAGYGGCVSAEAVNLTVRGGSWRNNSAAAFGGAIDASGASSLVMQDVTDMQQNVAVTGSGGAVHADTMASVLISGCLISNNTAAGDGGCLWAGNTYCVLILSSSLSKCISSFGSGGGGWISLPSAQSCPAAVVLEQLPSLSAAAASSLAASGSTGVSLLLRGAVVSSSNGAAGGALAIQSNLQSAALLDQVHISGCNAVALGTCTAGAEGLAADGGGLSMTMTTASAFSSTCSHNVTSASINITSSTFTSNSASFGNGGAATVKNPSLTAQLQVNIANSTFSGNSAANGGALYAQGAGAFLSLLNTSLSSNVAMPSSGDPGVGSVGGCIYAKACQGVLVEASQLSMCEARSGTGGVVTVGSIIVRTSGRSLGGGVMADGCVALVLNGSSVSNSTAGAGGGLAVTATPAVLISNSELSDNSALAVNLNASLSGTIDLLSGAGGALWASGASASLLQGSRMERNRADLLGGAVAALTSCTSGASQTSTAQVPSSLLRYPQLALLLKRAAGGCYAMSVQQCLVSSNVAQGSGGGFYALDQTSVQLTCRDITSQLPIAPSSTQLRPFGADLSSVAFCATGAAPGDTSKAVQEALGNQAIQGYGPTVASLPVNMGFNLSSPDAVTTKLDPTLNASSLPDVPLLRFLSDGSLLLPSTSPLTYAVLQMRVVDAFGQDVRDPLLSTLVSITTTSPTTNSDVMNIFGQRSATYDNSSKNFVFDGISLKAVVDSNYSFVFSMTSSLWSSSQVQPLNLTVVVPACGDGEVYTDPSLMDACLKCDGSFFAFSQSIGQPAPECFPCPSNAACSGGAVMVPSTGLWHSAPNSTEMHQCLNNNACVRTDDQLQQLQNCQTAWYEFRQAVNVNALTETQAVAVATDLLIKYDCYLYDPTTLPSNDPRSYLSLLCADGYGGNLCGVCVVDSNGRQNAMKSNNNCSACSAKWVVYLVTAGLFFINLLIIMIQVTAALGEQMLSNTLQFADIFSAIINHVQYLIVILKLQFNWPTAVTDFHRVIASTVSFANDAIKFASITCLSDGSPEAQATYTMGAGLVLPLILVCTSIILWTLGWFLRVWVWYPHMDRRSKVLAKRDEEPQQDAADATQIMVDIQEEELHLEEDSGKPGSMRNLPSLTLPSQRRDTGVQSPHPSAQSPHALLQLPQGSQAPSKHWREGVQSVVGSRTVPEVDAADDQAPPQALALNMEAPSLKRNQTDLRRWQLPGAEKVPEDTLWFNSESEARKERSVEEQHAVTLVDKMRMLDKYMPLPQQLLAVVINTGFVVYQGWVSAALSVFNCQLLDDGQLGDTFPDSLGYYSVFQAATASNGYWQLNMNQACYEDTHLTKWTPIGSIMSFVLGLGIPFMTFLPVYFNRKTLTQAETQLRWGWMYIRYYYGRLPYWMSVQMLELLVFMIVQTFSGMLTDVIEQAALLQLTLILTMIFNTCMWPLVHPVLILVSFMSNSTLVFTLGLAIIIGDGSAWLLTPSAANTAGAFIVLVNTFFVVLLVLLFYKHMRDVIREGFLELNTKARVVVSSVWVRSLKSVETLKGRSFLNRERSRLKREDGTSEKSMATAPSQPAPEEPAMTGA